MRFTQGPLLAQQPQNQLTNCGAVAGIGTRMPFVGNAETAKHVLNDRRGIVYLLSVSQESDSAPAIPKLSTQSEKVANRLERLSVITFLLRQNG